MIVEEFWIFYDNGEPIVHFLKDPSNPNSFIYQRVDIIKLAGLLELISESSPSKNSNPIKLKNYKYLVTSCFRKKINILLKTDEFIKNKAIIKISNILSDMVENLYKIVDLINWNKDISLFEILKKKLNLFSKMSNL